MSAWPNKLPSLICVALLVQAASLVWMSDLTAASEQGRMMHAEELVGFDIPAQDLAAALELLGAATGRELIYDGALVAGLRSHPVRGQMTRSQAIVSMLRDTGLVARAAGEDAITIIAEPGHAARLEQSAALNYYGVIQDGIQRAFCADPQVKPGAYRISVRLWIGLDGALTRAQLLGSTGEAALDQRIAVAMSRVLFAAPPPEHFAQPVSLVIEPRPLAQGTCENRSTRREADLP
jgi:TonB family protein